MSDVDDVGRLIGGRFQLSAVLGAGGFGRVWRAYDERLGLEVAVKEVWLPPSSGADRARWLERARREVRNAARSRDHPNIVAVHDVIEDGGAPWMVMQLVQGRSLDRVLAAGGPLSQERAVEVARGVLAALEAAHEAGLVHRDVKPANIMISADGRVRLGDFGIAVHADDSSLTTTGAFLGSAEFAAPEVALGGSGGPAADLFSLGATLYAAVEGASPFRRGNAMGALYAVVNEHPPTPTCGEPLAGLITRLLAKDPEERPTIKESVAAISQSPAAGPAPGTTDEAIGPAEPPGPSTMAHAGTRTLRKPVRPAGAAAMGPAAPEADEGPLQARSRTGRARGRRTFVVGLLGVAAAGVGLPLGVELYSSSRGGRGTGGAGAASSAGPSASTTPRSKLGGSSAPSSFRNPDKKLFVAISVTAQAFRPGGQLFAVGLDSGWINFYNAKTWQQTGSVQVVSDSAVSPMVFSPDGAYLAAGGNESSGARATLVDVDRRTAIAQFQDPAATFVGGLAFTPDGEVLAMTAGYGRSSSASLWQTGGAHAKIAPLPEPAEPAGVEGMASAVAINPKSTRLVIGGQGWPLQIWDLPERKLIRTMSFDRDGIGSVAFSPDGAMLAGGGGAKISLWRAEDLTPLGVLTWNLPPHAANTIDTFSDLTYSPDGHLLAASMSGFTGVWDVGAQRFLASFLGSSPAFSTDGKVLTTLIQTITTSQPQQPDTIAIWAL